MQDAYKYAHTPLQHMHTCSISMCAIKTNLIKLKIDEVTVDVSLLMGTSTSLKKIAWLNPRKSSKNMSTYIKSRT